MTTAHAAAPARSPYRLLLGPVLVAVATVTTWFAWLGQDTERTLDPVTMSYSGPYTVAQVAGCVLTLVAVLVIAILAGANPWVSAAAMTVAFTVAWTAQAASTDESGLYVIGAALVVFGMSMGTAVIALITSELRKRFSKR